MKYKLITLPSMLTLERIKHDTLVYLNEHKMTRVELSYLIDCHKSNLSNFLNRSNYCFQSKSFINLLNILSKYIPNGFKMKVILNILIKQKISLCYFIAFVINKI